MQAKSALSACCSLCRGFAVCKRWAQQRIPTLWPLPANASRSSRSTERTAASCVPRSASDVHASTGVTHSRHVASRLLAETTGSSCSSGCRIMFAVKLFYRMPHFSVNIPVIWHCCSTSYNVSGRDSIHWLVNNVTACLLVSAASHCTECNLYRMQVIQNVGSSQVLGQLSTWLQCCMITLVTSPLKNYIQNCCLGARIHRRWRSRSGHVNHCKPGEIGEILA